MFIPLFLLFFALSCGSPTQTEWATKVLCSPPYVKNSSSCTIDDAVKTSQSAKVSSWQTKANLANSIPSFIVAGNLGTLSDRFGRRPLMLLPVFGGLCYAVLCMVAAVLNLSLPWLVIANFVRGICGDYPVFLAASFAYVADTTDSESRTTVFSLLEGVLGVGMIAGPFVGGHTVDNFGFEAGFGVMLACYAGIATAVITAPESVRNSQHQLLESNEDDVPKEQHAVGVDDRNNINTKNNNRDDCLGASLQDSTVWKLYKVACEQDLRILALCFLSSFIAAIALFQAKPSLKT